MGYKSYKDGRVYHFYFNESHVNEFLDASKRIWVLDTHFVPYKRYILSKIFLDIFGSGFSENLVRILKDYQAGCLFLHFGERLTQENCIKISTAISHQINRPSASDPSGLFYAIIKIADSNNPGMKLYEPYKDFPLHTDGVFKDNPVDWLMMMKVFECNVSGGESHLLHMEDWECWDDFYNRQENQKMYMHGLFEKDKRYQAFSKVSSTEPTYSKILSLKGGERNIKFVDQYVVPSTIQEASFLEDFQCSLESSKNVIKTKLPPGSMVLINNNFWAHGRARFEKNVNLRRELLRQYGCFEENNLTY